MLPIYGVKSPKKLYCLGVDRHFQVKLANCGSMVVCHLQLDHFCILGMKCFLRMAVLGLVS